MDSMKIIDTITLLLIIIGGINWGLSAFGYNLVNMLVGAFPPVDMVVYVLVAVSALYQIKNLIKGCQLIK
ncbi:MAG: DUF378 domain-containing protein [Candidatus ainarchaeum sp.]|nr:DUF378 domain-containing protein [Candidatus ainarchaeum sp.]